MALRLQRKNHAKQGNGLFFRRFWVMSPVGQKSFKKERATAIAALVGYVTRRRVGFPMLFPRHVAIGMQTQAAVLWYYTEESSHG